MIAKLRSKLTFPPGWACRSWKWLLNMLPNVYGPRGMIMLGKAMVCACFGLAYIGVLNHVPSPGLQMVSRIMPLSLWAVAWFIAAFMLVSAAFRVDHSRALGVLTTMLSLWSLSYFDYFLREPVLPNGRDNLAFLFAVILAGMAISAIGIARMLNHGKSHLEVVELPGETAGGPSD
jgi:hypothetical protein